MAELVAENLPKRAQKTMLLHTFGVEVGLRVLDWKPVFSGVWSVGYREVPAKVGLKFTVYG